MPFSGDRLIRRLAGDDSLTRGLGDVEARMLVDWLTDWAEILLNSARTPEQATGLLKRLNRRGRAIRQFLQLWAKPQTRGAAIQLAATERFCWPLPDRACDPVQLMENILNWERVHEPEEDEIDRQPDSQSR